MKLCLPGERTQKPAETTLMQCFPIPRRFYHARNVRLILIAFVVAACANWIKSASADLWALNVDSNHTAPPGTEDSYNNVLRFEVSGNQLISEPGIPHGHSLADPYPLLPVGIAVGPDGNVYVSDAGGGRILRYNGITGQPVGNGVFEQLTDAAPSTLAFGPDGNLYMSEFFGTAVRVYNPTTGAQLPDAVTGLTSAGGLAFASNGDLLVGDGFVMGAGQMARIARVHNGTTTTFGQSGMGALSSPVSLLTLKDDSVLAVDLEGSYVAHFAADGSFLGPFAITPPPQTPPASNFPSDVKFDPDGNLIVSILGLTNPPDNRGALLRYDLDGNAIQTIISSQPPLGGFAWTPSGTTLIGNYNGTDIAIDQTDYAKWVADYGKLVAKGNGADGNGDGIIDAADYTVWRDHLGNTGIITGGVPEPASMTLWFLGGVALAARMLGQRLRHLALAAPRIL
jgi:sugar lactone lactonase YvrE